MYEIIDLLLTQITKKKVIGLLTALKLTFCEGLLQGIKGAGDPVFYSLCLALRII